MELKASKFKSLELYPGKISCSSVATDWAMRIGIAL